MLSAIALVASFAIDFDSKAAAVGQVLEGLSAQTHTSLKAAPAIAGEIVFIRSRGQTLETIKTKIAEVLDATWRREGDAEVLFRPPAFDKQIWNRHIAYRRKLVDQALAQARERVKAPFSGKALVDGIVALPTDAEVKDDPEAARRRYTAQRNLFALGPLARLTDRLLLACDPDDLAAVGPFDRRIFRINPTPMQRGFDRARYDRALSLYAQEQQAWIDEASKDSLPDDRGPKTVADPRTQLRYGTTLNGLELEIRRGEMAALFLVNVCADQDAVPGYSILSQTTIADPARAFLDSQQTPRSRSAADKEIALSPESQQFESRMAELYGSKPGPSSPQLRAMLENIQRDDPLSWTVSDGLRDYADQHEKSLIAALPDAALGFGSYMRRTGPLTADGFMRGLIDAGVVSSVERNGWISVVPTDAYEARIDSTPRAVAAALIKSVVSSGRLDIRDYARYAFESGRLNRGGIGDILLRLYDPAVMSGSDRTNWKALQLYGSLSEEQQKALEASQVIRYQNMTPAQRSVVERLIYAEGRINGPGRNVNGQIEPGSFEPTTRYSNGLPATTAVAAGSDVSPVILAFSRGSDGVARPARVVDRYMLATFELQAGSGADLSVYGVPSLCGYAMATQKVLNMRVEVEPDVFRYAPITLFDFPSNASPVAWDKLPEPNPTEIARIMADMKTRGGPTPPKTIPPLKRVTGLANDRPQQAVEG